MSIEDHHVNDPSDDDWVRLDPLDDTPPHIDRIDTVADQTVNEWPAAEPGYGTADWEIPDGRTRARNCRFAITLPTSKGIEWVQLNATGGADVDEAAIIINSEAMVDLAEAI